MRAKIGAHLRLYDAPPSVAGAMRTAATFVNPQRVKAERYGGRTARFIPERITLWAAAADGALVLPRGLVADLRRLAPVAPITDRTATLPPVAFRWRGELRAEQAAACRAAFAAGGGVVVGPCGSGKTVVGLALAAAWRQPTLWIVHTLDLAQQALERARGLFDLPPSAFGLLGGGRETVGTHLTVATVQTLARRDLGALAGRFGTVVLDEAHHAPATTFLHVVQAFPARYRLGLTATPDRADGLGAAMLAVLGPVAARLTTAALASAGRVVVPEVRQVPTAFEFRYAEDYAAMLEALTTDVRRNALIAAHVAREARAGHSCLVLSERVAHLSLLAAALAEAAPDVAAAVLTGQDTARRRAQILEDLRAGRLRVLLATKLADEGLDVPALGRVFLASGGRAASRVEQQVGRCMRPAPGKAAPVVFDFCDFRVGVLAAQARARAAVYADLGATVRRAAA